VSGVTTLRRIEEAIRSSWEPDTVDPDDLGNPKNPSRQCEITYGFMTRSGGRYRVATELPPRDATVAQEEPPDEDRWLAALIDASAGR